MADTFKVGETSRYPQVIALVQQLGMQGKTLDYALVDAGGNVHAFKPLNETLVIIPQKAAAVNPVGNVVDQLFKSSDFAGGLEADTYNRQLTAYYGRPSSFNTRNLWFIGGIGIILMVALYARKKGRA